MRYKKQTSLEARIASFKEWKSDWPKIKHLAYSGFQKDVESEALDAVTCVFCTKCLEGWTYPELPHREHLSHSSQCILMNLASPSARHQTFEYGVHPFRPKITYLLASEGLFIYNIKEGQTTLICYACGFKCTIISFPQGKSLKATITDLHTEFDASCEKKRETEKSEDPRENPPSIPYKILSCEVDLKAMPTYFIQKQGKNLNVTRSKLSKSAEALAQALDTVQRESTSPAVSQLVSSPVASEPVSPAVSEPASPVASQQSSPETPEQLAEQQKKILRSNKAKLAAESRSRAKKAMEEARTDTFEPQPPASSTSASQQAQDKKKEADISLPEPENIVNQLALYISKQEKESLTLQDALRVGLNRMIEVLGKTTYEEIEELRRDLLASLADA